MHNFNNDCNLVLLSTSNSRLTVPCGLHSQKRASCSKSAADLLQVAVIKPISGCFRIACSGLMTTSLLQVVNRLAASFELQACCKLRTGNLLRIANVRLAASCERQTCCKLRAADLLGKLRIADLLQVVEIRLAYHIDKAIKKHRK